MMTEDNKKEKISLQIRIPVELEAAVRRYTPRRGDLSRFAEEAFRVLLHMKEHNMSFDVVTQTS